MKMDEINVILIFLFQHFGVHLNGKSDDILEKLENKSQI